MSAGGLFLLPLLVDRDIFLIKIYAKDSLTAENARCRGLHADAAKPKWGFCEL